MTEMTMPRGPAALAQRHPRGWLLVVAVLWWALYQSLASAAATLTAWLPVDPLSHLGGAIAFFLYDTPKVLLLLSAVTFVMGMKIGRAHV